MMMPTVLEPEDVPGAKLKFPRVKDHSVQELRRWLECRGLKITGNKELILRCVHLKVKNVVINLFSRVQNSLDAGRPQEIFIGVDSGMI